MCSWMCVCVWGDCDVRGWAIDVTQSPLSQHAAVQLSVPSSSSDLVHPISSSSLHITLPPSCLTHPLLRSDHRSPPFWSLLPDSISPASNKIITSQHKSWQVRTVDEWNEEIFYGQQDKGRLHFWDRNVLQKHYLVIIQCNNSEGEIRDYVPH